MTSLIGFLVLLAPLVVVHEFGHYFFAKLFNVKAEIFSVGFGPKLFAKKWGETEWRFSAFPLGGYVKLLGEDPSVELSPEDQARALQKQAPFKRFFIFFGGPLFNFIFAIFVFMAILVIGEQHPSSLVGRVLRGSVAERVGFLSGDRVISVDQRPVSKFEEITEIVNENPNKTLTFEVKRPGLSQNLKLAVQPGNKPGFTIYGEQTTVGEVDGLLPMARSNDVGISDPKSLAAKEGIVTGDKIIKMNGTSVSDFEQLERMYQGLAPGAVVELIFQKQDKKTISVQFKKEADGRSFGQSWGLYSTELFIESTLPDSPASKAGIKKGDRLVSVGGSPIESFFELRDQIQKSGEKEGKVSLGYERDGKTILVEIVPTATQTKDPLLNKVTQYTIGVAPQLNWADPEVITERILNPFVVGYKATQKMFILTYRNIVSIKKLLTGDVSVSTLGGPILIGKIAGESLARGLIAFLTTMAMISVGLGVLNILPVPVLDGGHLLMLTIEIVRGKPLTVRQMEVLQQVGLSLILLLMVVVLKNDIARLAFFN